MQNDMQKDNSLSSKKEVISKWILEYKNNL